MKALTERAETRCPLLTPNDVYRAWEDDGRQMLDDINFQFQNICHFSKWYVAVCPHPAVASYQRTLHVFQLFSNPVHSTQQHW